jgi:hypothetical protein
MLARIQTLYLFLVVLSVALNLQILPFWTYEFRSAENAAALQTMALTAFGNFDLNGTVNALSWGFSLLLILTGINALATIFLFKNRKLQRTLATIGLVDSIVTLALGISAAMMLQDTLGASGLQHMPGSGFYLFALTPVWFLLAARGIKKDDEVATAYKRL